MCFTRNNAKKRTTFMLFCTWNIESTSAKLSFTARRQDYISRFCLRYNVSFISHFSWINSQRSSNHFRFYFLPASATCALLISVPCRHSSSAINSSGADLFSKLAWIFMHPNQAYDNKIFKRIGVGLTPLRCRDQISRNVDIHACNECLRQKESFSPSSLISLMGA